jgi:hypothetical protein
MASKKKMAKKGNAKVPMANPIGSSQEGDPAIEPSPKVSTCVDLEIETMSSNSAVKTTIKVGN